MNRSGRLENDYSFSMAGAAAKTKVPATEHRRSRFRQAGAPPCLLTDRSWRDALFPFTLLLLFLLTMGCATQRLAQFKPFASEVGLKADAEVDLQVSEGTLVITP